MQELNRTNDVKLPIDEQMNEVGGLPPRSEYHKKGRKKKFKIPAIKTLAFAFLLPILIGLLYYFQIIKIGNDPTNIENNSKYFESVEIE